MEFQPSKEDLQQLREWIKKTPHVLQDYDDEFLSAFVRSCKGSLQKAKTVIENFNGLGMRSFDIFGNFDLSDPKMFGIMTEARIFPLPKLTTDGSMVLMQAYEDGYIPNASLINPPMFFRLWLMLVYIYIWEKKHGSGKWIILFDCKYSHVSNLSHLTPVAVKQILQAVQTAIPVRLQAIHAFNVPPFLERLSTIIKSVTKKKMADRVFFHSSMESFHNSFPKELLPKEYGGPELSVAVLYSEWKRKLESYQKRLLDEQQKMRKLDPLRPKSENELQEMVGTFKKLDLD